MNRQIEVIRDIAKFVGTKPCETGGLLLAIRGAPRNQVDFFLPDERAGVTSVTYSPNVRWVGECLETPGVELRGFVHSHPRGYPEPSDGDFRYVGRWFEANPQLEVFHLPIIEAPPLPRWVLRGVEQHSPNAILEVRKRIRWYVVTRESDIYML